MVMLKIINKKNKTITNMTKTCQKTKTLPVYKRINPKNSKTSQSWILLLRHFKVTVLWEKVCKTLLYILYIYAHILI